MSFAPCTSPLPDLQGAASSEMDEGSDQGSDEGSSSSDSEGSGSGSGSGSEEGGAVDEGLDAEEGEGGGSPKKQKPNRTAQKKVTLYNAGREGLAEAGGRMYRH